MDIKNFLSRTRWVSIVVATICLGIVLSILSPVFLKFSNMQAVLVQASVTGIMSVGMAFIILTGGIDISVGATLFFSSSLFAQVMMLTGSYALSFVSTILCACLLGALNGYLVVTFNITPLITTLATYTMYRGMAIHLTGAKNIPVPREMGFLGNGKIAGIPVPIILLFIIFGIGVFLFTKTRLGIYVRAIGNSAQSATESNLPVNMVTIVVYMLGGLTAGLSGLILLARVGGLQSGIGIGTEFTVIAAVVLGGTKLTGGSGSIIGSVIGAIFLVLINNGLNLVNASPYIYDIVRGAVLLVAVIIDRVSAVRQAKIVLEQKALRIQKSSAGV